MKWFGSPVKLHEVMTRRASMVAACALVAAGCAPGDSTPPPERAAAPESTPPAAAAPAADLPKIVILGDSLTAGLGLEPEQAFPSLLQKRLDAGGHRYQVVNAGVSGDTTAGGLRRLEWSIEGDTRILVVALGGNDGLRGLPVSGTRANLEAIIARAKQRGITVVLAGMEAPPNYGAGYTDEFRQVFRDLARAHDVAFIPFLLEGVAGVPALNQRDGIHPNPDGARRVERLVWAAIEPILEGAATR
jgi:acyl-CoA thioesterase-1